MVYYEMIVFLLVVLTGIPIIVGFFFKNKVARVLCWSLSLPLLAMTITTINKHSRDVDKERTKYIGYYKLDIEHSYYKHGNLLNYKNLVLHVFDDDSFTLSDTSCFIAPNGNWEFVPNEDIGFVRCSFKEKKTESLIFVGNGYWGFQHDCFRNGIDKDVIYFKKIGTFL